MGLQKGKQRHALLETTWENNQDFNGIILALDHLKSEGPFKLYFSNIKIILD